MEWTIAAFAFPAKAGTPLPTRRDGRLSWPWKSNSVCIWSLQLQFCNTLWIILKCNQSHCNINALEPTNICYLFIFVVCIFSDFRYFIHRQAIVKILKQVIKKIRKNTKLISWKRLFDFVEFRLYSLLVARVVNSRVSLQVRRSTGRPLHRRLRDDIKVSRIL